MYLGAFGLMPRTSHAGFLEIWVLRTVLPYKVLLHSQEYFRLFKHLHICLRPSLFDIVANTRLKKNAGRKIGPQLWGKVHQPNRRYWSAWMTGRGVLVARGRMAESPRIGRSVLQTIVGVKDIRTMTIQADVFGLGPPFSTVWLHSASDGTTLPHFAPNNVDWHRNGLNSRVKNGPS